MRITFFDIHPEICAAWERAFAGCEGVSVLLLGKLKDLPRHACLVAPGNSLAVMTGGLDLAIRDLYGQGLQDELQDFLLSNPGVLALGRSVMVEGVRGKPLTGPHSKVLYVPTMEYPRPVFDLDIFQATIAAMGGIYQHKPESVAIPAFGTGAGQMPPTRAAEVMRLGYDAGMALWKHWDEAEEKEQAVAESLPGAQEKSAEAVQGPSPKGGFFSRMLRREKIA